MSVAFDPKAYEQMSDGDLMRIAMDRDELTPEALSALEAQLAARGLRPADVTAFADTYRAEVAADDERHGFRKQRYRWTTGRGIGPRFYGKRNVVQMQSREQYQATRWFTLWWIPLVPLGTYIVHRATTSWLGLFDDVRPLRKIPMDWEQVFQTWAVAALVLAAIWFLGPLLLMWSIKR